MFSILSMQDVLPNLRGGDKLFKLFDPPRLRKKSTGSRMTISSKETSDFPIKKVWLLPSHLLVSIKNGGNAGEEVVVAYDQVPKLVTNDNNRVRLMQDDASGQVHDIFHSKQHSHEYLFIVLRTGQVNVWIFTKPEYRWTMLKSHTLCKGRESQIVSFVYDDHIQTLVWCERRSVTQFCVCKCHLRFIDHATTTTTTAHGVVFEDVKAILHNCSPMNIYALPSGIFSFIPVSNKPLGLFMFWSNNTNEIAVRMWGEELTEHSYVATSSDYQTIIRDCMSLWMNCPYNSHENRINCMVSHPSTKELIVVQTDLRVYLLTTYADDAHDDDADDSAAQASARVSFMCRLEELSEGRETFVKQILKFFTIQSMLLFVMTDGTINIFDKVGLFLWKTQTFRSRSPKIWLRKGNFPIIGVWNSSGIWSLRPKSIAEQLKEFSANRYCINEPAGDIQLQKPLERSSVVPKSSVETIVPDPDFALNLREITGKEQTIGNTRARRFRIKQGVNRSEDLPVRYLFGILRVWQLRNVSMEIALDVATKVKELKESGGEIDLSEVFSLVDEIQDPVLLLVLFGNKQFPFVVRKRVDLKLRTLLRSAAAAHIETEIVNILSQYFETFDQIQTCYVDLPVNTHAKVDLSHEVSKELSHLEDLICSGNSNLLQLDQRLCAIMDFDPEVFLLNVLNIIVSDQSELQGSAYEEQQTSYVNEVVSKKLWNVLLSDSMVYRKTCSHLWQRHPNVLMLVVNESKKHIDHDDPAMFQAFLSRTINLLNLPYNESKKLLGCHPANRERAEVYISLLTLFDNEYAKAQRYDTLLNYGMIDEALVMLSDSELDHHLQYSMFYQMVCYLVQTKLLSKYTEKLNPIVPEGFKLAEFYSILSNRASMELGRPPVFTSDRDGGMSVGNLKLFLEALI